MAARSLNTGRECLYRSSTKPEKVTRRGKALQAVSVERVEHADKRNGRLLPGQYVPVLAAIFEATAQAVDSAA